MATVAKTVKQIGSCYLILGSIFKYEGFGSGGGLGEWITGGDKWAN